MDEYNFGSTVSVARPDDAAIAHSNAPLMILVAMDLLIIDLRIVLPFVSPIAAGSRDHSTPFF
jgi:hypothetical protein